MVKLLIKYIILLIISKILIAIGATTILAFWPFLLTTILSDGSIHSIGTVFLTSGIDFLFNSIFVLLLIFDMKKLQIWSIPILILTLFSSLMGIAFFFLILSHKMLNQKQLNYDDGVH